MSATIQSDKFSAYFNQAPVFYVKGRSHQVEMYCANEVSAGDDDYLYNSVATVLKLHRTEPLENGFLVFLTGQEEIDLACKIVFQEVTPEMKHSITALPLYSSVTPFQQAKIFQPVPRNSRKVIFATNIAETSITIPGIRIVVDSGKVKQKSFTSQNRVDVLKKFVDTQSPEIWRTNLSSVVLDLVKMGLRKMKKIQLIDPPDPSTWKQQWMN
uniref:RNA helicase n=1 Tax=Ditylenchus dipsaci TaxID=166011 RepID=A0A915CK79_9BILA